MKTVNMFTRYWPLWILAFAFYLVPTHATAQFTCWNKEVVPHSSDCPPEPKTCWDGSAIGPNGNCPPKIQCPNKSYVTNIDLCPKVKTGGSGGGVTINIDLKSLFKKDDVECWDGSKASKKSKCPSEPTYTCWNGAKVVNENQCPPPPPYVCWNRTQAANVAACPPKLMCWDGSNVTNLAACPQQTFTCWQGSVVDDEAKCPPKFTCWDGSLATDKRACPAEPPVSVECWNRTRAVNAQSCPPRRACPDGTSVTDMKNCPAIKPVSVTCWNGDTVADGGACPARLMCWDGSYVADRANCPIDPNKLVTCPNGTKVANQQACPTDPPKKTPTETATNTKGEIPTKPPEPNWVPAAVGGLAGLVAMAGLLGLRARRKREAEDVPPAHVATKTAADDGADPNPKMLSAAWVAALALAGREEAKRGMVFGPSAMTVGALASIPLALRPAYKATGRIGYEQVGKPTGEEIAYGTGVLITDRHIMTNRHVWEMYGQYLVDGAEIDNPGIEFIAEKDSDKSDFVKFDGQPPQFFPGLDVAIFTLAGEPNANRVPITLATETPETMETQEIAVIGYPQAREVTDEIAEVVEADAIFGVKRISEGQVFRHSTTEELQYGIEAPVRESINEQGVLTAVCHNASTLGGSSGSCVVDSKSGEMIAIHFGFDVAFNWEEAANFAIPAADIIPHVEKLRR